MPTQQELMVQLAQAHASAKGTTEQISNAGQLVDDAGRLIDVKADEVKDRLVDMEKALMALAKLDAGGGGDPPPPPPPPPDDLALDYFDPTVTPVPDNALEMGHGIGIKSPFWPGMVVPWDATGHFTGVHRGFQGQTSWGETGTLWGFNAYNMFGDINMAEFWEVGDFQTLFGWGHPAGKGREGHAGYARCVPHLDTDVRFMKGYRLGGQGFQREFRTTETDISPDAWAGGGGTFRMEDCDFRETGLLDEVSGGSSPRGSWCYALYATMQRTILERCIHVNAFSPAPHEGSVFIGFGQAKFRTPYARISDCRFYTVTHDRADIFLQGVDDALVETTEILGANNYVDVVEDCGRVVFDNCPSDFQIHIKQAPPNQHRSPIRIYEYEAGTTKEIRP